MSCAFVSSAEKYFSFGVFDFSFGVIEITLGVFLLSRGRDFFPPRERKISLVGAQICPFSAICLFSASERPFLHERKAVSLSFLPQVCHQCLFPNNTILHNRVSVVYSLVYRWRSDVGLVLVQWCTFISSVYLRYFLGISPALFLWRSKDNDLFLTIQVFACIFPKILALFESVALQCKPLCIPNKQKNAILFVFLLRYSYLCPRLSQPNNGRASQKDIDGHLRPTMPFVGQAEGERRLRTLSFCEFKLRKLESIHRGNATVSVCVG